MDTGETAKRIARTAIDMTACGLGIASLPISAPVISVAKVMRAPSRVVAGYVLDGTIPVVGPPVARALDGLLHEAA